jgi:hypothetical protein
MSSSSSMTGESGQSALAAGKRPEQGEGGKSVGCKGSLKECQRKTLEQGKREPTESCVSCSSAGKMSSSRRAMGNPCTSRVDGTSMLDARAERKRVFGERGGSVCCALDVGLADEDAWEVGRWAAIAKAVSCGGDSTS